MVNEISDSSCRSGLRSVEASRLPPAGVTCSRSLLGAKQPWRARPCLIRPQEALRFGELLSGQCSPDPRGIVRSDAGVWAAGALLRVDGGNFRSQGPLMSFLSFEGAAQIVDGVFGASLVMDPEPPSLGSEVGRLPRGALPYPSSYRLGRICYVRPVRCKPNSQLRQVVGVS